VSHNMLLVFEVTILVLAIFLGFEVISKVPTLLHTPLMSGTNAIHGIVVAGAMIVLASGHKGPFIWVIGFLAVVLGSANVVGGFVVTDRMLEMFKKREPAKPVDSSQDGSGVGSTEPPRSGGGGSAGAGAGSGAA
jgi:NAD(P) transhydrogenase subunit alpha